jgi:hypothetical protein
MCALVRVRVRTLGGKSGGVAVKAYFLNISARVL